MANTSTIGIHQEKQTAQHDFTQFISKEYHSMQYNKSQNKNFLFNSKQPHPLQLNKSQY